MVNIDVDEDAEYLMVQATQPRLYDIGAEGWDVVQIVAGVDNGVDVEGIGFEYCLSYLNRR